LLKVVAGPLRLLDAVIAGDLRSNFLYVARQRLAAERSPRPDRSRERERRDDQSPHVETPFIVAAVIT
jgi:hypothetical protein